MGYYDENGLWIEDGTTYIFKPGSSPGSPNSVQSKRSETIKDSQDEDGSKDSEQKLLWSGKNAD